jgi:hypothetical protein
MAGLFASLSFRLWLPRHQPAGLLSVRPKSAGEPVGELTKPLLLEEFFKIKREIGQLIYTHIDLIMADKTRYERCSKDLFEFSLSDEEVTKPPSPISGCIIFAPPTPHG